MKLHYNKQKVYDRLSKDELFGASFPHLMKQIAKGKVWAWDNNAYTTELTDEQIEHIEHLEEENKSCDLIVYAVLDNVMQEGSSTVHMISYLYVTKEPYDVYQCMAGVYYAMANVQNKTWDINESGSVLIGRCAAGGPKRVG